MIQGVQSFLNDGDIFSIPNDALSWTLSFLEMCNVAAQTMHVKNVSRNITQETLDFGFRLKLCKKTDYLQYPWLKSNLP